MDKPRLISQPLIAWGRASRELPGQTVCGDLHVVKPYTGGVLLAVVDGLGHGDEATLVAKTAVDILQRHASEPLEALFRRCHEALIRTRGVVMTVATIRASDGQLSWLGVGNVEAVLLRANREPPARGERVLLRGGLVGYLLPELHGSTTSMQADDLLIFATDGISAGFTEGVIRSNSPQQIADHILRRYFRGNDDALVLVVRYI